jgi:outer membrane lipoprotein-sorting protein
MNCREFQKRMPELLDRDPDPALTGDLLAHADACPRCAGELRSALSALSAVSPSPKLTASPGLKERAMQRILVLESQPSSITVMPAVRRRTISRPWRYAMLAAAMLAVFAVFSFRGGSSNAFAEVVEQFKKLRACTYKLSTVIEGAPTMEFRVSYKEPGHMRMDVSSLLAPNAATSIIDSNRKKLVTLVHSTKQCITNDLTGEAGAPQISGLSLFEDLRRIPATGAEAVGSRQIGAVTASGFRINMSGANFVIWADPAAGKPLLVEYEMANAKGMKGQMSEFNFDAQLDDSLFSLDPPAGYTVTNSQALKMTGPSEEAFLLFLRKSAERMQGDLFPETVDPAQMAKSAYNPAEMAKMVKAMKKPAVAPTLEDTMKQAQEMTPGLMFVMQMAPANDFHYAGKGIALGNAQKPIAWYKPTGAQNYRVIYGDLSVRDVTPAELPKVGAR